MRRGTSSTTVVLGLTVGLFAALPGCDKNGGSQLGTPEASWATPYGEESAYVNPGPKIGYGQGAAPASAVTPPARAESSIQPSDTTRTDAAMALTDEQILAVLDASRAKQIEEAKLTLERSKNKNVRAFAEAVLKKNQESKDKQQALAQKTGIVGQPSERAATVKLASQTDLDALEANRGAELDRAFVELVMQDIKQESDFIDNHALPNVQRTELKTLVEELRTTLALQLSDADALADKLRGPETKKRSPVKPGAATKTPVDPGVTASR